MLQNKDKQLTADVKKKQLDTLVTIDKLTLTRHYHLESLVYVRVSILWILTNE